MEKADIEEVIFNNTHLVSGEMEIQLQFYSKSIKFPAKFSVRPNKTVLWPTKWLNEKSEIWNMKKNQEES